MLSWNRLSTQHSGLRTEEGPRSSGVEHVLGKDGVTSSNLVEGSTENFSKETDMARAGREIITLQCTECKRRNYSTTKNKKTMTEKLELKKFCRHDRKHTVHRETK